MRKKKRNYKSNKNNFEAILKKSKFLIFMLALFLSNYFIKLGLIFNQKWIYEVNLFLLNHGLDFYYSNLFLQQKSLITLSIFQLNNCFPLLFCSFLIFKMYQKYQNKSKLIKLDLLKYRKLTIEQLCSMDWQEYEELIKKIFQNKGYSVERMGGHGSDGGIDLIIQKSNRKSMVQCKRYSNNVGVKIVREMFAVGIHHNFEKVYIYSSAGFSKDAYSFAKGKNIHLVNGIETLKEIQFLLNKI